MSAKAVEPGSRAGFLLLEALVALVVAGLLLPVLAQALATAWWATRRPLETVTAVALARAALVEAHPPATPGFGVSRSSGPLSLEILPSRLAPAPPGHTAPTPDRNTAASAVPAGMRLAVPTHFGTPAGEAASTPLSLRRTTVIVSAPSGRQLTFTGISLDGQGS